MTLGVDVGGTFTDFVYWTGGRLSVHKRPTTPQDQSIGLADGAAQLIGAPSVAVGLRHGTTVATNALLERRGARTVLVTDPGFEDVLEIARQDRPSLYDSFDDRPVPLVERGNRIGIPPPRPSESPVDGHDLDLILELCAEAEATALAICFIDSYKYPGPEAMLRDAISQRTSLAISISSEVVAEFREYERSSTTVLNAFLMPEVARYLARLGERTAGIGISDDIAVMRSSGGLIPLSEASRLSASILLSGPAGGVVAASGLGAHLGYETLISFDMGGTSTDVCRIEGARPEVAYRREVAGFACQMPSVAVHTVGAGGGSIGWVDGGGALRVGPRSAGADPGPAAYNQGGTEATVTDANLVLGRLDPSVVLAGSVPLDGSLATAALGRLGDQIGLTPTETAQGMLSVVESHMAHAIHAVSTEQGLDPREAALVAFGGAGGLHGIALARSLEMRAVIIPPHAGVFSALGLLMSPPRTDTARTVNISEAGSNLLSAIAQREVEAATMRFRDNTGTDPDTVGVVADVRYQGQAHETSIPYDMSEDWNSLALRFHDAHEQLNGFSRRSDPVEVVTMRGIATGAPVLEWDDLPPHSPTGNPERGSRTTHTGEGEVVVPVLSRGGLEIGQRVAGPAIIEEGEATTFLNSGESAIVHESGALEITW